jgi:4-cresol dehydrogenase (hydroxylating)
MDAIEDSMATPAPQQDAALAAMRAAIGDAHVLIDPATLDAYAMSTSAHSTRPLAVAFPGSSDDVVALVKIAAQYKTPLYPISTGKNWGYGDACAVAGGQVVVQLSRMNHILAVDATLAYAVIEPGVTQQQLASYLQDNQYALCIDCTGAGPDTSLVGNILERGFGHSPYGNRLQTVCGLQVVLANGDMLQTGFGHYPAARATYVYPYGVGPFLDGLFTQSNFGIVTRLGMWLMPRAACIKHFICTVSGHADIAAVVDALRPLRLDGTLRSIIHIGNDLRLLSGRSVFPRERAPGATRLPMALRTQMAHEAGIAAWTVSGALYGSTAQVAAARQLIGRALRGIPCNTVYLTERKLAVGAWLARILGNSRQGRSLSTQVALGKALFNMNRGNPDGRFLAGAYWRRRQGLPAGFPQQANPARDRCGLLWVSPVLPMRGADLLELHALVEPIFAEFGFDLFLTCSMVNERSLAGVITIAFDQDAPDEVARARACYDSVYKAVTQAGYVPYRVGLASMAALDPHADTFWATTAKIKDALDPDGLLAPGRYEPRRAGAGPACIDATNK